VTIGAGNVDKLSKLARSYFSNLDARERAKARKDLDKILAEVGKIAKAEKLDEPLLAVEDWRQIIRLALSVEKPTVKISSRESLRIPAEPLPDSPVAVNASEKELAGVFDGKLKAFVSVPGDYLKVAYPVVVAMHPMADETVALKDLTKSKVIVDRVQEWVTATYPREFLAGAIVIAPVMDLALRSSDGVSFYRPQWDTMEGATWVFRALLEYIFKNVNHDPSRIFLDGEGSGAVAGMIFCARYPGLQTGCIVRGAPPQKIDFTNCTAAPILFLGGDSKDFFEEWKQREGFKLEHRPSAQPVEILQWIIDHPKNYAPEKISLRTDRIEFASSYWLRVTDEDPTLQAEPILIDAAVDREQNSIAVVTSGRVKAFEVYLNDGLIDLSKPIRVTHRRVGGADGEEVSERFNGLISRVIEHTLNTSYYRPYCNSGEVYVATVRVELD
jgi:hypothetical protein